MNPKSYNLADRKDVRRMLLDVEAENLQLMTDAEADHIAKVMTDPLDTDEDFQRMSTMIDIE